MAQPPARGTAAEAGYTDPATGRLVVHIPHPLAKDVQALSDEELDALLGEHAKMASEIQSLSDADLDTLLQAGQPPQAPGMDPGKGVVVNPPQKPLDTGEMVAGGARELASGALFEFGDEAEAAARAPFSDKSYDEILRDIRRERARFSQQYPATATGLNIAGGVGSMLLPGAGLAGRLFEAASGVNRLASPVARVAAKAGAQGALAGIGSGETAEERAQNALTGGVLGLTLGTGMHAAGRGAEWAKDTYRNVRGLDDEARAAETAADMISGRVSPDDLRTRLDLQRRYGVPGIAATATPELATLAETVIREPSAGRTQLAERLAQQQAGAPRRAQTQLEAAFPGTPDYFEAEGKIIDTLRRNANARYGAAYAAAPEIRDPAIRKILSDPDIQSAYMDALRISRREQSAAVLRGEDPAQYAMKEFLDPVLDDGGNLVGVKPSGTAVPDLRSLDQIKQALDRRITSLYSSGQGGEATALRQLRDDFVKRLDAVGPAEYKAARAQYKGDIEVKDALELGRKALAGNGMRWQQVAKLVRGYSPGEKEAFKTGVLQKLMQEFENTSRNKNFAHEIINTPNIRNSLREIVDPAQFPVLEAALKREAEMFKDASRVMGGSNTFGRAAEKQAIDERVAAGDVPAAVDLMLNPTPGNLFKRTVQALTNMRNANVSRATYGQLAKMLSASTPAEVDALLAALEKAAPARAKRELGFERGTTRAGGTAARIVAGQSPEGEVPPQQEVDPAQHAEELLRSLGFTTPPQE